MPTQIQVRNDTASNWSTANTLLLAGEIGYETDTGRFKIGNGTDVWSNLTFGTTNLSSPPAIGNTLANTVAATTMTANTIVATVGAGFQNMTVLTSGVANTWSLPASLQVVGAKFKATLVGGGGAGGGTAATAGHVGAGGGGGGTVVVYLSYVAGQNTVTYTVGSGGTAGTAGLAGGAGSNTTFAYNSVTYTAVAGNGGANSATITPGAGGAASGGTLNIAGSPGYPGGVAAATAPYQGVGGSSALGLGIGATPPLASNNGIAGTGYGAGGGGGYNAATATARTGGGGTGGVIIIEY